MKRHIQTLGVRKWSGNDLLELQSEGLSVLDNFFAQYGNCIIDGCEVAENTISKGLVSIDGMVLPFDGATDIHTFPVYLKKSETHEQREYADGIVRDIAVEYYAEMVLVEPSDSHIMITAEGNVKFLNNVGSGAYEAPTLANVPGKNTLTYTKEGIVYYFLIGQQCRIYDETNEKYVFYQLYSITDGVADWQSNTDGSALVEIINIILKSNQEVDDAALLGKTITIIWLGQEQPLELIWNGNMLSATIPMSVQYEVNVESISDYTTPNPQSYFATGGNKRHINLVYLCEKIVATVRANDGTEPETQTVTVKHAKTDVILASGVGVSVTIKVPMGTPYKVSVDDWAGFIKPSEQSFTANNTQRDILFEYERKVDATIFFDKSISDPSNITGEINEGVLAIILSKFRRCLCKKTVNGEVAIAYLKDRDSTMYEDGTFSDLTGVQGDVMVDFPEFYYKREDIDANKFCYRFAEHNVDGAFIHVPRSLVGAYKAYLADNKLYSRSGVNPTVSKTFKAFSAAAQARGIGYQLIDFQQHCVIAFMLYAKYGNRNLQAVLGLGGATYSDTTETGTTNSIGNIDTLNENTSGKYVNGLGLEGVFGGIDEWVQGVSVNNMVWTITDPDGAVRKVTALSSYGWIKSLAAENGVYFDIVPTNVGGSETTYYSDHYSSRSGGPFCLLRSYYSNHSGGGVAYTDVYDDGSDISFSTGTRLAFRGKIIKTSSISVFEALPIV